MTIIPFIDLQAQRKALGSKISDSIQNVLEHGQYILGPEVTLLEEKLAAFAQARHCVTCANGTDAIQLCLMAEDIGPGDAVIVPDFTFAATAEAVAITGATPVFCDVEEDTFLISPASAEAAVQTAFANDLKPKAIIVVGLFGHPVDCDVFKEICNKYDLILIDDAAQSFGSRINEVMTGAIADYTTTSFFPAKPLGCYGDGGAILTNSPKAAETLRSLRFHGKGSHKYEHVKIGLNSRLDTIQAAVLLEKLAIFSEELKQRGSIAQIYNSELSDLVKCPVNKSGIFSSWAQYTICVEDRDAFQDIMKQNDIPTMIYYPVPMSKQPIYKGYPVSQTGTNTAQFLSEKVVSLPMHPYLTQQEITKIVAAVKAAVST